MNAPNMKTPLAAAVAAAQDFKQLLDIQQPGTLIFPGHKGDARTTATYARASLLLNQAASQDLQTADGIGYERRIALPLAGVVAKQGANVPANQLQLFAGITAAIAQLAFQVLDEYGSCGEQGGSLEIGVRICGKADVVLEEVKSKGNAVHKAASEVVIEKPLCHGATTNGEVQ